MSHAAKGANDLGVAGLITTRKTLGTNPATSDHDVVAVGAQLIPVAMAVKMGMLDRSAVGVYTTLAAPAAGTRVNS